MIKVLAIDAEAGTVESTVVNSLEDMQKLVGGLIALGARLPNGDEVFVNDEGLLCEPRHFFAVPGGQPLAGNGFIIGPPDDQGESTHCKTTVMEAREFVEFRTIIRK